MSASPVPAPVPVPAEVDALEDEDETPPPPRQPRLVMPLIAAGMIALSLERLGALHWIPAVGLFALLALLIFGIAASQRRALRKAGGDDDEPKAS